MAEEVLQEVEGELSCPVCLDTYTDPKLLQCFHIYCKDCLQMLLDKKRGDKIVVPCPECRQETPVPKGVEGLPSAFYVNRLLGIVGKPREGKAEEEVKWRCSEHTEEVPKLYCETCGILICWKCAYAGAIHHDHDHSFIDEAFKRYQADISSSQEQVKKQMTKVVQALQRIKKLQGEIDQLHKTASTNFREDPRKVQIMSQMERLTKEKRAALTTQQQKLEKTKTQLKSCLDFMKNSMASTDCQYEVLKMKSSVMRQVKGLIVPFQLDAKHAIAGSSNVFDVDYFPVIKQFSVPVPKQDQALDKMILSSTDVFACPATDVTRSYYTALLRLPIAFYYNALTGIILTGEVVKQRSFPPSVLPIADAASLLRRSTHDSFRPPLGQPTYYLFGMGYGKEVGLPEGMHEVYDPSSKKSLILDHTAFKIVLEDPRPGKKAPVFVQPTVVAAGNTGTTASNMPYSLCTDVTIVQEAAQRARSKPVGCTLYVRGQNGQPGVNGNVGSAGANGRNGMKGDTGFLGIGAKRSGKHGNDGGNGGRGGTGGRGTNGCNGGDVIVTLSGSADELKVTGSKEFKVRLGSVKSEQVLLVDCHGGDGGKGGQGGRGGPGGNGGKGGDGVRGDNSNIPGQNGGNGGNGGDGGDGGFGGQGGDAGDGGDAGNGGSCLIQTADPKLLMLVEADCLQGESGAGAKGGGAGAGGKPGVGGKGGKGGSGGPSTETWNGDRRTIHLTYSGHPGLNGRNGNDGRPGANGKDSKRGRKAQAGGILWVLKSEGRVIKANTRFDAQVLDLKVESTLKGGIFEPNERIVVSEVRIKNTGGLDLPSGAIASMTNTDTVKFEPCSFEIPAIAVGSEYKIPFRFHGRIFDTYPPNKPGRENFKATLSTRIELLGRPFEKSLFRKEIEVRYPVQLGNLRCPQFVDRGEVAQFSVEVSNVSNLPYGSCKGSGGRVVLQLHFDSRLIPLGKVASDGDAPYDVTYNHNVCDSTFVELHEIQPKKTITIRISVLAEKNAELFAHCYWQADLRLRDKLIEYNQQSVRVTPKYDAQKPSSDILLVTSQNMTNMDFVFWSHLFHTAGVSFDIWDTSLYSGFSIDSRTGAKHRDSWCGRYAGKTIIYFHTDPWLFSGSDIARLFHGDNFGQMPLEELNSSLIVFTPQSSNYSEVAMLKHLAKVNPKVDIPENAYRGLHLSRPNLKRDPPPYAKCEKKIVSKLEKNNPTQLPLLSGRETQLKSLSCFSYSYGSIDVRYLPLLKSSKYLLIDSAGSFDAGSSPFTADIQLSSKYGQAIVATIFGLSIPAKLRLLKKQPGGEDAPNELMLMFVPSKGPHLSLRELVMITLASEVADELFTCSGEVHRMQHIHDDIMGNTQAYLESGRIVLRGLKLIEREIRKRRSACLKHAMVTQANRGISNMIKSIRRALVGAGVKKSKLKNLTSLGKLQTTTVHRCHQQHVKDGNWNLVDV